MTVVAGFSWLTELVMIADTRVSWPDASHAPQDVLRKLHILGDVRKPAVLGFSGDLPTAKTIISFLMEHKLRGYRRRFAIARFKDDLLGWIQEVVGTLDPTAYGRVTFMLGGIEPSRHPAVHKQGRVVGTLTFPEIHLYIYTVCAGSGRVLLSRGTTFAVIGSGSQLRREICAEVREGIQFGFRQPNLHWARAYITGKVIASLFKDRQSTTVGGPFQVVRLAPTGLEEQFVWPPGAGSNNAEVHRSRNKTIIIN